jgi:hypothetical protein
MHAKLQPSWLRRRRRNKGFRAGETPAFPKRSSLAGTMDEARPLTFPWLKTTRN